MDFKIFIHATKKFSVAIFCTEEAFQKYQDDLEKLDAQPNVKIIVQPVSTEGLLLLSMIFKEFQGDIKRNEKDFFLEAFTLDPKTPPDVISKIAKLQHQRITATLESNMDLVLDTTTDLNKYKSYLTFFKT